MGQTALMPVITSNPGITILVLVHQVFGIVILILGSALVAVPALAVERVVSGLIVVHMSVRHALLVRALQAFSVWIPLRGDVIPVWVQAIGVLGGRLLRIRAAGTIQMNLKSAKCRGRMRRVLSVMARLGVVILLLNALMRVIVIIILRCQEQSLTQVIAVPAHGWAATPVRLRALP